MNPEFHDPRLVAIYDAVNAYGPDAQPSFYTWLAKDLRAQSIVDLGAGTGIITCALAELGYHVVGVEPSALMLAVAQRKPHAEKVTWIHGDVGRIGTRHADLAFMSGHVAQFFLTDDDWHTALTALHAALRPGGVLAFESRNPAYREWEHWTRANGSTVDDPVAGAIETWSATTAVRDGFVDYTNNYRFLATGETLTYSGTLRFRSEHELAVSLAAAGFTIERVYGDWDRRLATPTTRELITVATRS